MEQPMRSARKSAEELRALSHALPERIERDQPDVGEATRWIREAIGANQAEFARLVGLGKPLIARIERGKANPTLDTLNAIGKTFSLRIAFQPGRTSHGQQRPPRPRRKLPPLVFDKITR
ncbi:helix-turn-helix domain-containing protein [Burkholderia gladioli]|uniref:helix-turn-helix domain-containing protein n=1 Tax=Burkholderia gladioli TaxID=28095 RepID=UPI00163FA811|nr:helix-turn-helix domain-containing protein [Burkholderia gladioli]